jgi:hypothetical protein
LNTTTLINISQSNRGISMPSQLLWLVLQDHISSRAGISFWSYHSLHLEFCDIFFSLSFSFNVIIRSHIIIWCPSHITTRFGDSISGIK